MKHDMNAQRCLLYQDPIQEHLTHALEEIETYSEDSHCSHRLVCCKDCGQLYLREFYETIDWIDVDDPQRVTYVPVESVEDARRIEKASTHSYGYLTPRLVMDFPKGGPKTIGWVGLD